MREAGYQISVTASNGDVWLLHTMNGSENKHRRMALVEGGWSGGQAEMDESEVDSVNQFGAWVESFRLPPFTGSLEVHPVGRDEPHSFIMRDWAAAWKRPVRITVVARDGHNRWCEARLVSGSMSVPSYEPAGNRREPVSLDWRCLSGTWFGYTRTFTGTVTLVAGGDVAPRLRLRWNGQATSFTLPNGLTVNLGSVGSPRVINLDYGYSGQVTLPDGTVDSATWSALRGAVGGLALDPNEKYSFNLGAGLQLEVTPRFLTPWG